MPATAKLSKIPPVTFSEYVNFTVEPEDLEAAGWVYVGRDKAAPGFPMIATQTTNEAVAVVRAWHDQEHPAAWPWCDREPCKDLR